MSTTNIYPLNFITNLKFGIDESKLLSILHLDNAVHSLLCDVAIYLSNLSIDSSKTVVRRIDDESFNLQESTNADDYELLITFENVNITQNLNDCKAKEVRVDYSFFYKLEAKGNNASKLKRYLSIVENLICNNYNDSQRWQYQYKGFNLSMELGGFVNQLKFQQIDYGTIETKNYYLAKQDFSLLFEFDLI